VTALLASVPTFSGRSIWSSGCFECPFAVSRPEPCIAILVIAIRSNHIDAAVEVTDHRRSTAV
jgi:hypothetical protein